MGEQVYEFASGTCAVRVSPGARREIGPALARSNGSQRVLVVSDDNVAPLYADEVTQSLTKAGLAADLHVVPAGESSKSLAQASEIYDRLAAGKYARDATILTLGGGVVGDLGGFVAATWMRGIGFVNCPTTLEADVDAAIGGKTAVNHPAGKNLIGAFYQPGSVCIDPECLASLPERDLIAGLAESIKHAAIRDRDFLEFHNRHRDAILTRDASILAELISKNVAIKAAVVLQDEQERRGIREALNFGHTVGHAIESWADYAYRHGEAVALGMVAACRLSVALGLLSENEAAAVRETVAAFGLPVALDSPVSIDQLREHLSHDKKIAGGRPRYVLLDGLGQTVVRDDVPEPAVQEALAALNP
ncbi:MAG: 3-dehydroquinate synthase [bacterium]|nr:3-dehydroquinate synthase [bacterium]